MSNKKNILLRLSLLLSSSFLINLFNCQEKDQEDISKNTKVLSCVSLGREAIKSEKVKKIKKI
jgi:hypothetical protein